MKTVFFLLIILFFPKISFAITPECKTGASPKDDYCRTNLASNISIYTGGEFGPLSFVIWGHWMLYDPKNFEETCSIEFNNRIYTGTYQALTGTDTVITKSTKDLFFREKGRKVEKDSAPFAACSFLPSSSYSILESMLVNTRYSYQRGNRAKESFYREEILILNENEIKKAVSDHATKSFERTIFDIRDKVSNQFKQTTTDKFNEIKKRILGEIEKLKKDN